VGGCGRISVSRSISCKSFLLMLLLGLHVQSLYGTIGEQMENGQILPRTGSNWLVRVYKGREPLSGRRSYKNTPVAGTRKAAEKELARQLALLPPRPNAASSLNDYTSWWLAISVEPRLRAKTAHDYDGHLSRYALPSIGAIRLRDLQPLDLQSAYSELLGRGLSPRTIRYAHSILHAALEQAKSWRLIAENPADGLSLPRIRRSEIRIFTLAEARSFGEVASSDPNGLVLLVALVTGLRPSEYLALRTRDFDGDRNTLTVQRTLERVSAGKTEGHANLKGRWQFAETKRPSSRRTVSIPTEISGRIAEIVERQANLFKASHEADLGDRLIFRTPRGRPIHERNLVQRSFKPLLKRAGLPNLRLYDLRHTFATLALRAGVSARLVSEQLGHRSIAFTLETYGHLLEDTRGEAAQKLSDLIFGPGTASGSERKPIAGETAEPFEKRA
jgi:integrase